MWGIYTYEKTASVFSHGSHGRKQRAKHSQVMAQSTFYRQRTLEKLSAVGVQYFNSDTDLAGFALQGRQCAKTGVKQANHAGNLHRIPTRPQKKIYGSLISEKGTCKRNHQARSTANNNSCTKFISEHRSRRCKRRCNRSECCE